MNKVVKHQLGTCKVANIPSFDDSTTHIFIPKAGKRALSQDFEVFSCYLIEVADYVLNPGPEFTLATNWNKGTIPPSKYMKVEVSQIVGKMIKIIGIGYDINNHQDFPNAWEGWLPTSSVKIISKL